MSEKRNLVLKAAIVEKTDRLYLFAQELGIHPAIITHVISGRWTHNSAQKQRWAKALGRPVDELFPKGNC